ncbi:hypothetical protein [Kordia sp.]|uniref:hypothetical protein n=1 Tax=Kordia sp. TaxID=1965332 RepID=UPI003B5A43FE
MKKDIIHGKRFLLPSNIKKYHLGTKKKVTAYIEERGGFIVKDAYQPEEFDHVLIGSQFKHFGYNPQVHLKLYPNATIVFEQELLEFDAEFEYLDTFFENVTERLRTIFSHTDIFICYYHIGKPYVSKDFKRLEKKHHIPKAIKEFYAIFGKLKLIWSYASINIQRSFYDEKDSYNIIASGSGEMYGSIQILDLKRVFREDWTKLEHAIHLKSGEKIKIFDYFSDENMAAFATNTENPLVYMGENHGVVFENCKPLVFTDYLKLLFNSYGFIRRNYLFDGAYAYGMKQNLPKLSEILEKPMELVPIKLDDI